jgi:hypothetical protein
MCDMFPLYGRDPMHQKKKEPVCVCVIVCGCVCVPKMIRLRPQKKTAPDIGDSPPFGKSKMKSPVMIAYNVNERSKLVRKRGMRTARSLNLLCAFTVNNAGVDMPW